MHDNNMSILVLGGARSGKSRYAEILGLNSDKRRIYVATARILDDEMKVRVAQHIERRQRDWETIEEPIGLAESIQTSCAPDTFVLVDCITLWLTNIMLDDDGLDIEAKTIELVEVVSKVPGTLVLVSNEVGHGIVPENALARKFRDAAGLLNQKLAEACDRVVLVTAGIPLVLKERSAR